MVSNGSNGNGHPEAMVRHGVALIEAAVLERLITEASNVAAMMLCTEDPNLSDKYPGLRDALQAAAAARCVLAGGVEVVPVDIDERAAMKIGAVEPQALAPEMGRVRDIQKQIDRLASYRDLAVDYIRGIFDVYIRQGEAQRDGLLSVIYGAVTANGCQSVAFDGAGTVATRNGKERIIEKKVESPLENNEIQLLIDAAVLRPVAPEPDKAIISRVLKGDLEVSTVVREIVRERYQVETGPDKPVWKMPGERVERDIRLKANMVTVEKVEVAA